MKILATYVQIKYLEYTFEIYVYSHCNMCNIPIYFCNTDTNHLQHTSETPETYVCNMRFQCKSPCCLGMEARRFVEFISVELVAPVEKAVTGPVEKTMAGRSGTEDGPHTGEGRGGQEASWRGRKTGSRAGCGGDAGRWLDAEVVRRSAAVESLLERTSGREAFGQDI
jgi:hypothetical protein